jgi:hypothetical protein
MLKLTAEIIQASEINLNHLKSRGEKELATIPGGSQSYSRLRDGDYFVAGLLSYAESGKIPDDLAERIRGIKKLDQLRDELRSKVTDHDAARALLNQLDMRRSWALDLFKGQSKTNA